MNTYLIFQLVDVVLCCFGRRHAPEALVVIGSGYGAFVVNFKDRFVERVKGWGDMSTAWIRSWLGSSSRQFSNA
jgi:hypothetical protein